MLSCRSEFVSVLKADDSVESVCVLRVGCKVTCSDKLELFARFCLAKRRFDLCIVNFYYGFRIEIFIVIRRFYLTHIFNREKVIIKHDRSCKSVRSGEPMDSSLYFSAVRRIAVAGFKVCIYVYRNNMAVRVFFNAGIFDDIRAHKSYFAVRFKTEELRRRNLCKVVGIDIELACKRKLSRPCRFVIRIV